MTTDEMETVIKKVCDEIRSENPGGKKTGRSGAEAGLLKKELLLEYMRNPDLSHIKIQELSNHPAPSRFVVCAAELENKDKQNGKCDRDEGVKFYNAILNLIYEPIKKCADADVFHEYANHYSVICGFNDTENEDEACARLGVCLKTAANNIKSYMNMTLTYGISAFGEGYESLYALREQAETARKRNYFTDLPEHLIFGRPFPENIFRETMLGFIGQINARDIPSADYRKEIISGIGLLSESSDFSAETVDTVKGTVIHWIHWPVIHIYPSAGRLQKDALAYTGLVQSSPTLSHTMELFLKYLSLSDINNIKETDIRKEVVEAVSYINDHYSEDITLWQVANAVEISANYLSNLFKKEMRIGFVDYVNQVRIERAKILLIDTHLKFYEVGCRVGFPNESYFSRIFKKITGMRPNEYKRNYISSVYSK